jgi:acetylglutamate kinase
MRKPAGGVTLDAIWEFMLRLEAEIQETQAIEAENKRMLALALMPPVGSNRHDTEIINANADIINAQVAETLTFQDMPWEDE